jgi:hypothetical protein
MNQQLTMTNSAIFKSIQSLQKSLNNKSSLKIINQDPPKTTHIEEQKHPKPQSIGSSHIIDLTKGDEIHHHRKI